MNFIKTLHELLTKILCIVLFFFAWQVGYGQILPLGDPDPRGGNNSGPFLDLPTIDVSIADVQFVDLSQSDGPTDDINYNVLLDFDIDLGVSIPHQNIVEFGFDIRLDGFNSWLLPPSEVLFCNGADSTTVTQNTEDPYVFYVKTFFNNGISLENTCLNFRSTASALVVESSGSDSPLVTTDCYDYSNIEIASVEITNTYIKLAGSDLGVVLNDAYHSETFQLPTCALDSIENYRSFDINLVISDHSSSHASIDVYFRYTDGSAPSIIESGAIWMLHNDEHFGFPTLNLDSPLNATVIPGPFGAGIYFEFEGANITNSSQTQIYLGTLNYQISFPSTNITSDFEAVVGRFTDQWGDLTSNVSGLHDVESYLYYASSGSVKLATHQSDGFSVNVSPTPANDRVFLQTNFDLDETINLLIYDMNGRLVDAPAYRFSKKRQLIFDVNHLNKGLYIVELVNKDYINKAKIIIE